MVQKNIGGFFTSREQDSLRIYLNDIRRRERYLQKKHHVYFLANRKAQKDFEQTQVACLLNNYHKDDARMFLIESNLRYVVSIAKHYLVPGVDIMDLVQAGNLALIEKIDAIKEPLTCSVISYAAPRIQGVIYDQLRQCKNLISRPKEAATIIHEYERLLCICQDIDFAFSGLVDYLCENNEKLKAFRHASLVSSMDACLGSEGDTFHDITPSDARTADGFEHSNSQQRVRDIVRELFSPFEANLFICIYGLEGKSYTTGMLCDTFQLNESQLHYLERKMLNRLRYSEYVHELRTLLA